MTSQRHVSLGAFCACASIATYQQTSDAISFGGLQDAVKKAQADPAGLVDAATEGLKNMDADAIGGSVGQAMKFLKDPSVVATTKKALEALQSGVVLDVVKNNKEFFLDQMEKSGVIPDSILNVYKKDNKKLDTDIKQAKGTVANLMKDPEAFKSFQEALDDPKKFLSLIGTGSTAMGEFQKSLSSIMSSPVLKSMCQSDEMKSLLSNPSKWADMAQKFREEL